MDDDKKLWHAAAIVSSDGCRKDHGHGEPLHVKAKVEGNSVLVKFPNGIVYDLPVKASMLYAFFNYHAWKIDSGAKCLYMVTYDRNLGNELKEIMHIGGNVAVHPSWEEL